MSKKQDTFAGLSVEEIREKLNAGRSPQIIASDLGRTRQALIEWLANRGLKTVCLPETKWDLVDKYGSRGFK